MQGIFPDKFIASLRGCDGFSEKDFIHAHEALPPPVSIRINPFKQWEGKESILKMEQVPWCQNGFYLPERPSFTSDPVFHAGGYYVQEASSMFLHHALMSLEINRPNQIVVDLCAAPGGKSTLLQSLLDPTSILLSNEVIKTRVGILQENLTKWGAANVIVTQNDPSVFGNTAPFCDFLIIDAPCSGSGLFRKDAGAMDHWSEEQVEHCSLRQRRILEQSLAALKPGGILLYSTCSYSAKENEEIGNWLSAQHHVEPVKININPEWKVVQTNTGGCFGYRFYPNSIKGEGFFLAAFKKPGDANLGQLKGKGKLDFTSSALSQQIKKSVTNLEPYTLFNHLGKQIAFPSAHIQFLVWALGALFVKQAGTTLGEWVKNELIPHHALAMSQHLHSRAEKINIPIEDALSYLRRATFSVEASPGWKLLTYKQLPLGWAKFLPNRVNNYYPKEWRIINR